MINTQRKSNRPVDDEEKQPGLTQPLLTHFSNSEDSDHRAVANTWASHHHVNDQNLLIQHLTAQKLSPSLITFAYLTAVDKINFFSTCKKSYCHPYAAIDYYAELSQQIDVFLRMLKSELKNTVYRRFRFSFSNCSYQAIFGLLLFFSLMVSSVTFSSLFISSRLQACYAVIELMTEVINSVDPANHCDKLVGNYGCNKAYFTKNPRSNCAPLCDQLTTLTEYVSPVAFVGLMLPGTIVLTPLIVSLCYYATVCVGLCIGTSRFDKLPFTNFSAKLNHRAEQLLTNIAKHPALATPALSVNPSVLTIRSALKALQRKAFQSNNPMRFFKADTAKQVHIEVFNDELIPAPSPSTMA